MPPDDQRSGFGQFVAEMKRRHVVRFSLGYAAAAFVVLQLAEALTGLFGIGEGGLRLLVVIVALGFLPSVVLAWIFDVTKEGIRRTEEAPAMSPLLPRLALLAFALTTIGVTGGVGWYLVDQDVLQSVALGGSGQAYDPSQPIRSLAVLPLKDFSPDGGQEYFAAGMHEELIAKLSLLDGVRVPSRTTVMQYDRTTLSITEIGRELSVDVIIEGSVTRSGDQVRITLQIIHAPSDSHIGTVQFGPRRADDVLALQTEVAYAVAREIDSTYEGDILERTAANVDPAALEAYFRGKHEYDRGTADGYRMALNYFEEALETDPSFAPALAGVAAARFLVALEDPAARGDDLRQAYAESMSALALDAVSLEVREVFAMIERSIPGTADSITFDMAAFDTTMVPAMTRLGRPIQEQVRRRSMGAGSGGRGRDALFQAQRLMWSGRYADASGVLTQVVRDSPELASASAWQMLARSRIASGDPAGAAAVVRQWHDTGARGAPDADWTQRLDDAVRLEGERGYWAWRLDRLTLEEEQGRPPARTELAAAQAALGNHEEAIELLRSALENGERGFLSSLPTDPVWDELRSDQRFQEVEDQAELMRFAPGLQFTRGRGGRGGR